MPPAGVPGGLPSQLQKLTCLDVTYNLPVQCDPAEQFQLLSSLTALQDLRVEGGVGLTSVPSFTANVAKVLLGDLNGITTGHLSGVQHLSQLTSLSFKCPGLEFRAADTHNWAHKLTTLERLSLSHGSVQADALAAFTQLRALKVSEVKREAILDSLLLAVSGLPQLTELRIRIEHLAVPPPTSAASTALTVGTNQCSLQLGIGKFPGTNIPAGCDMFTPGMMYPHMRKMDLCHDGIDGMSPIRRMRPVSSSCATAALIWGTWRSLCPMALHMQP
jgi:hypothetical protein